MPRGHVMFARLALLLSLANLVPAKEMSFLHWMSKFKERELEVQCTTEDTRLEQLIAMFSDGLCLAPGSGDSIVHTGSDRPEDGQSVVYLQPEAAPDTGSYLVQEFSSNPGWDFSQMGTYPELGTAQQPVISIGLDPGYPVPPGTVIQAFVPAGAQLQPEVQPEYDFQLESFFLPGTVYQSVVQPGTLLQPEVQTVFQPVFQPGTVLQPNIQQVLQPNFQQVVQPVAQPILQPGTPLQPIIQPGTPLQPVVQPGAPLQPVVQPGTQLQPVVQASVQSVVQPVILPGAPLQPETDLQLESIFLQGNVFDPGSSLDELTPVPGVPLIHAESMYVVTGEDIVVVQKKVKDVFQVLRSMAFGSPVELVKAIRQARAFLLMRFLPGTLAYNEGRAPV